ncbi:MAG: cation:proton antiporter [Candidatus Calescibacterium sp.]|jgi:CPA2 family monovalent cation:H+ antiporter-2|nr:cation:proton antiporter [Candidatus Calescibacterium sp.]
MIHQVSYEFFFAGLSFVLLFAIGYTLKNFRVPYVLSFMLGGILLSLILTPQKDSPVMFKILEHIAIPLLFFFIGLDYSFEKLKGAVKIFVPGIIDFVFNFIFPFLVIHFGFGLSFIESFFLASVIYPSSTAITSKLLFDYRRLANPEAEFLINLLIFEDLVVILLLPFLYFFAGIRTEDSFPDFQDYFSLTAKLLGIFLFFFVLYRITKRFSDFLDRISDEDIFIFLIFGAIILFSEVPNIFGVPAHVLSAFLLGVVIPETKIKNRIEISISPIRELSLGVFFFLFGYKIDFVFEIVNLFQLIFLLSLTFVFKILSTYISGIIYGLRKISALRGALSFCVRGEFSFVILDLYEKIKDISFLILIPNIVLGILLFAIAPKISELIFIRKRKS